MVLDGRTGKELYAKKSETVIRTDSILPMLIAMAVMDESSPDDFVLISQEAQGMSTGITGTQDKVGLKAGERLTVRQLLTSVLLANSQDACKALSSVYASDNLFLTRIQEKIQKLNLTNTVVSSYLITDGTKDHTTVKDMALVMREFMTYPLLSELSRQPSYTFVPNNMVPEPRLISNTNQQILPSGKMYYSKASAGFLASAAQDAVPFSLFVSASSDAESQFIVALAETAQTADNYTNSKSLADWAFNNYKAMKLISKGDVISNLPLSNGSILGMLAEKDFYYLGAFGETAKPAFSLSFKPLDVSGDFIEQNQIMGSADIVIADKVEGTINLLSSKALSLAEPDLTAPRPGLLDRILGVLIWIALAIALIGLVILIIRTYNFYKRSKRKQQELRRKREILLEHKKQERKKKAKQQVINRSNF